MISCKLLITFEHSFEDAARSGHLSIAQLFWQLHSLDPPPVRTSTGSATVISLNAGISNTECRLNLFDLMGRSANIVLVIEWIEDHQFWGHILNQ